MSVGISIFIFILIALQGSANRPTKSLRVAPLKVISVAHIANFNSDTEASINVSNTAYADAARMALREFEKEFEVLGLELRVVNYSHSAQPAEARRVAEQVVKSDAVGVIGFYESGKALDAAPLFVQAGLQLITSTTSAVKLNEFGPLIRTLSISNRQMARKISALLKARIKAKKVLMAVEEGCSYCSDLAIELKTAFGLENIQLLQVDQKKDSHKEILSAVLKDSFDAIVLPNQEAPSAKLIQYLLESGIRLPFVGGDGWGNGESENFFKVVTHSDFEGYIIGTWDPDNSNKIARVFSKDWFDRFYTLPTNDWAMVYEGARFLIKSIYDLARTRKEITRASVASQVLSITDYEGVVGKYNFVPGQPPKRYIVILKSNSKKKRFEKVEAARVD